MRDLLHGSLAQLTFHFEKFEASCNDLTAGQPMANPSRWLAMGYSGFAPALQDQLGVFTPLAQSGIHGDMELYQDLFASLTEETQEEEVVATVYTLDGTLLGRWVETHPAAIPASLTSFRLSSDVLNWTAGSEGFTSDKSCFLNGSLKVTLGCLFAPLQQTSHCHFSSVPLYCPYKT